MRCVACDAILSVTERLAKNPEIDDFEELCANCLAEAGIFDDILEKEEIVDILELDDEEIDLLWPVLADNCQELE